jgi:preprotein translocase SecE subunit
LENDRKWIYLSYVMIIGLVGYVLHKAIFLGLSAAKLPNPKVLQVMPASAVAGFVVATLAGWIYFSRPHVSTFALEVLQELKKVTWPEKKMAYMSTIVVVVVVMIASVILGFFDWVTNWVVGFLLQA